MALTKETINGVNVITTDNDSVPVTDLQGDGGDIVAQNAAVLSALLAPTQALTFDTPQTEWDIGAKPKARLTLTDGTQLTATGLSNGQTGVLFVKQDNVGGHALDFDTMFESTQGAAPVVDTDANAVTVLYVAVDEGVVYVTDTRVSGTTPEEPEALHPTIEAYVNAVNLLRATAMISEFEQKLNEFWLRLENRDAELSGDLTGNVIECFILRGGMNAAQGDSVLGILGTELTRSGGTAITWGFSGITFSDYHINKGSSLFTDSNPQWTCFGWGTNADTDNARTGYIAGQFALGDAGRTAFQTKAGNVNKPLRCQAGAVAQSDTTAYWDSTTPRLGVTGKSATHVWGRLIDTTDGRIEAEAGTVPVGDFAFAIGARGDDTTSGQWIGTIGLVLLFDVDLESQRAAIKTILTETLLA